MSAVFEAIPGLVLFIGSTIALWYQRNQDDDENDNEREAPSDS